MVWCDDPMKTHILCALRDAHAVDLSTVRLVLLQFGGSSQERNNISLHLDHECLRTKTNQKLVVEMERARLLRTPDAEKLSADLRELESLQMKRQVLQEFTSAVIRSDNSLFTSNSCPSFTENKSKQDTSSLCVTHEEFLSWLRKGAI